MSIIATTEATKAISHVSLCASLRTATAFTVRLFTATVTAIATTRTMPIAMRYGAIDVITLTTSLQLMSSIVLFLLFEQ